MQTADSVAMKNSTSHSSSQYTGEMWLMHQVAAALFHCDSRALLVFTRLLGG